MTHKHSKKLLAAMIAAVLAVSAFAGCADEDSSSKAETSSSAAESSVAETESKADTDSSQGEEPAPAEETDKITATAVKYSSAKKYTTKVQSKEVDLSGISADKVEVTYIALDEDALIDALSQTADESKAESDAANIKYSPGECLAKVDDVKKNEDGSFDITFTDGN